MLTQEQLARFTAEPCDFEVSAWVFTGWGNNGEERCFPPKPGIYEIEESNPYLGSGEDHCPATTFFEWRGQGRHQMHLYSVDPRIPSTQHMGAFTWRGMLVNGVVEPFIDMTPLSLGPNSSVTLDDDDEDSDEELDSNI